MAIFETHAHYIDGAFDSDREELLNSLKENGIEYVVEIGDTLEHSKMAIELANKYDFISCAIGIHPENVSEVNEETYKELENLLNEKEKNKIVAIGEIGLDYYWDKENKEVQKEVFKKQLDIALKYDMPVVVHTREASLDTFEIIKEYSKNGLRGIIHCFSESLELAKEYEKLGMYIGIGGVVTFKNGKKLVEVVKSLDLKSFVLETDSPYLSPEPNRGMRNDSRNLKYVVEKISEIKGVSSNEVENITFENAKKIYNLK